VEWGYGKKGGVEEKTSRTELAGRGWWSENGAGELERANGGMRKTGRLATPADPL